MNIDKIDINLTEETYAYIYRRSEEENALAFKENVKKYINIINSLVNTDFNKLSDEDFYDLLCKVYSITLTREDYLKIISIKMGKKYNTFTEIGTFMTFTDTASEGRGRSFNWWKQLYQIKYLVAVSKDFNIPYDSTFSKKDIQKMIDNKSIVIVDTKTEVLDGEPNFKKETAQNFPSMKLNFTREIFGDIHGYIYKDYNFSIIISMLRKIFTKEKILKDMQEYIEELQVQIEEIISYQHHDYHYNEISKLCNEWFEKSEEKQIYKSLQGKLKEHKTTEKSLQNET